LVVTDARKGVPFLRFRGLVEDVLRANAEPEALRGVIEHFNEAVKAHKGRTATFRKLDILALLQALAALTKQPWIRHSGWFAKRLVQQLQDRRGSNAVVVPLSTRSTGWSR
jgi:hypothetical protein